MREQMSEYSLEEFLSEEELDTRTMGEVLQKDNRTRKELVEDCYNSEGREILNDVKSLYSTLKMVNKNYGLLVRKRDEFLEKDAIYWMESHERMQDFFSEYMRLLHNYAASVHTLTHHTYTFFDRYEKKAPDLKSKYSQELSSRDLGVKVNLLKQIRHYTQKNWTPPISATISPSMDEEDEDEMELTLDKEEMLDWDGWSAEVQPFLKSFDEDIIITDLAKEYQEEVNDFYDWFRSLLISTFYDEVMVCITARLKLEQNRKEHPSGTRS